MAITRTQEVPANGTSTAAAATWGSTTTAGALLVAILGIGDATRTITPPSGWVSAQNGGSVNSGTPDAKIYYIANAASRSGSESFGISGTSTPWTLEIREYAGAAATSPLDAHDGAFHDAATAGPIDPGALTTVSDAGGVAIPVWVNASSAGVTQGAPSNSYTSVNNTDMGSGNFRIQTGEKIGGLSLTSEDSTVSLSASKRWSAAFAVFKPASGANTVTVSVTQASAVGIGPTTTGKQIGVSQASAVAFGPTVIGKVVVLAQGAVIAGPKTVSRVLTFTQNSALATVKQVGKPVAVTQASALAVTGQIVHLVSILVSQASSVSLSRALGKVVPISQAASLSSLKQVGKPVAVTQASSVAVSKRVGKVIAVAQASGVTLSKAWAKTIMVTQSSTVTVTKRFARIISLAQASSVISTRQIRKPVALLTMGAIAACARASVSVVPVAKSLYGYVSGVGAKGDVDQSEASAQPRAGGSGTVNL